MKTLVTTTRSAVIKSVFNEESIERLNAISDVDWVEQDTEYSYLNLMEDIKDYDAVISSWGSPKITKEVLENAPKLKFVGHVAGSVVAFVDPVIFEKDITVVNANRIMAYSTAELAVALMMAGTWDLHGYYTRILEGKWASGKSSVPGLSGQIIGIIGYGEISKEVIRLIRPFNTKFLVYSSYCPQEEADKMGFELCNLDDLLKRSDIISLHNTLTSRTRGMIGKEQLDLIRDGALLVNTARGPIIDETALVETLKTGRIYAALDVYDHEPLPLDSEFLKLPNVTCVPHIGALSNYYKTRMGLGVIEDMERWIKGDKLEGAVNLELYNRMTPG